MHSQIKFIEYYLPKKIDNLSNLKNDNPTWDIKRIYRTTGIKKRHIEKKLNVIEMAEKSCKKLIQKNKIKKVDFLILVTQSPAGNIPTNANILHHKLNLSNDCIAFDVNQGCSGFIYGLAIASSLIEANLCEAGIVVCAENYTKYINKNDTSCRPIFSDGSASTYITKSKTEKISNFVLGSEGRGYKNLIVPHKDYIFDKLPKLKKNQLHMDGSKVYMFTLMKVKECFEKIISKSKIKKKDIDFFLFHQASKFVLENLQRKLMLDENKFIIDLKDVGNTVSASIPIALKRSMNNKKITKNSKILLLGFGVGYSWGGCLIKC